MYCDTSAIVYRDTGTKKELLRTRAKFDVRRAIGDSEKLHEYIRIFFACVSHDAFLNECIQSTRFRASSNDVAKKPRSFQTVYKRFTFRVFVLCAKN